jgi:undecaprenyl-diphosphatase
MGTKFTGFFVTNPLILPQNCVAIAAVNPLAGPDRQVAGWFHAHLTQSFVTVLRSFSEIGSSEWIGIVLSCLVLFFVFKRWWPSLVTLVLVVPGGMLLNEWLKIIVHRHRPFVDGPFVDWSGYSFASGHTIGATLLYGQLALFIVPAIKSRRWRVLTIAAAMLFVLLVGFSRIALGAHYLTDVLGGMFLGTSWLILCLLVSRTLRRPIVAEVLPEPMPELVPIPVPVQAEAPVATASNSPI